MDTMTPADEVQAIRELAIKQVERNASMEWKVVCWQAIKDVAFRNSYFTTDDVWKLLEEREAIEIHEPRAMGATMTFCEKKGICEATDQYQESKRRECHGRPVRIWRSKIFVPLQTDMFGGIRNAYH